MLGEKLKKLRKARGLTQTQVAEALGLATHTAVSKMEAGKLPLDDRRLAILADLYGVQVGELFESSARNGGRRDDTKEMDDAQSFDPIPMPSPATFRKGLPVYGVAACHNGDFEGGFELNTGEVVDRVSYPPALTNVKNAYAIYATGSSMEPRYEEGELVYVHPGKPPSPGCYVVVQLRPDHEGGSVEAYIKRLVRRTAHKVILEQFNPAKTLEIPVERIFAMHRILNGSELF